MGALTDVTLALWSLLDNNSPARLVLLALWAGPYISTGARAVRFAGEASFWPLIPRYQDRARRAG